MPTDYRIKITNEKLATYRVVGFLIILANLFLFGFTSFHVSLPYHFLAVGLSLLNLAGAIIFYRKKTTNKFTMIITGLFIINAIGWLILERYAAGALLVLLAFFNYYTNRELVIAFSAKGISYPSFPPKTFAWSEVEQVMLKDDILTIDLKDNRLFQFSLPAQTAATLDAAAFNRFCKEQLSFA